MKNLLLLFMFIGTAYTSQAAMYVCYGNENNCFGSNGNCVDLEQPCSTEPGDYSIGGCNCTQLLVYYPTHDEFMNLRTFKVDNYGLYILNAEGTTWNFIFDMGYFENDYAWKFRYVATLNRVVIDVYLITALENVRNNGAPYDYSTACVDNYNIPYAD